ncbi:hypothetical protein Lal_00017025 [Lupinus albus]|nr:hypothetical protein Lal_00017025 [Lupinus albus]
MAADLVQQLCVRPKTASLLFSLTFLLTLLLKQHFVNRTIQIEEPDVTNSLSKFESDWTVNKVVAEDLVPQLCVWPKTASLLSHFSLASLTNIRPLS